MPALCALDQRDGAAQHGPIAGQHAVGVLLDRRNALPGCGHRCKAPKYLGASMERIAADNKGGLCLPAVIPAERQQKRETTRTRYPVAGCPLGASLGGHDGVHVS